MSESASYQDHRATKRLKMLKFNARVASIKLAQCDLTLKGTCSKFEHEADHKRRLHLKEVNQLKYDFRLMQVDRKKHEILAKKANDPEADVSEEEHFILQSTKYLANDQVGAFYLSKKNPFPTRHFSNPTHISIAVHQARQALAKHMAERTGGDQQMKPGQNAGSHRGSAAFSVASTTCSSGGTSSTNSTDSKPRPQTSVCAQPWRRQVHFEQMQQAISAEMDDDASSRELGKKVGQSTIPEAEHILEKRPHTSPFHPRTTSITLNEKTGDWVSDRPSVHPRIRRSQTFHTHTGNEFGSVRLVRSQSISDGRMMREMRQEKNAADEKVKVFLCTLKEKGLAAELHTPKPVTYYRHVSTPGPRDYWRRLGEKMVQQQEEERRKSQPTPVVDHQLMTEDRAKKHSLASKLSIVVKNIMKMKRTCEILEYEKLKDEMNTPKHLAETETQTVET